MSFLIIAESNAAGIDATSKVVTAVSSFKTQNSLSGDVHVLSMGTDKVSQEIAMLKGVDKVLWESSGALHNMISEDVTELVLSLADKYDYIIASASTTGKNIMPRVAACLDVMVISDVVAMLEDDKFVRPVYAGNALQTVKSSDSKKVVTIRTTCYEPAVSESNPVEIDTVSFPKTDESEKLSVWLSDVSQDTGGRPELTSSKVVISGGRGMSSRDNFTLLEKCADKIPGGAAVGASRAAVDAGYANNDMQVGQTGKVVAPDLYIAVGISGAIQHLAGMKDSKVIVAINNDPDAPIFQIADYGIVGDLFTVLPELEKAIEDSK